jgi:hypothetical protein
MTFVDRISPYFSHAALRSLSVVSKLSEMKSRFDTGDGALSLYEANAREAAENVRTKRVEVVARRNMLPEKRDMIALVCEKSQRGSEKRKSQNPGSFERISIRRFDIYMTQSSLTSLTPRTRPFSFVFALLVSANAAYSISSNPTVCNRLRAITSLRGTAIRRAQNGGRFQTTVKTKRPKRIRVGMRQE